MQFDAPLSGEDEAALVPVLEVLFDRAWYVARYPDLATSELDPLVHFIRYGLTEQRDPNRFFDGAWYLENHPDVSASGYHPLRHYMELGARSLRRPHPNFDAAWYVSQHPEAAGNPLLFHMSVGFAAGYPTEKIVDIGDYLPSRGACPAPPPGVFADVIVPVRNDFPRVRSCLTSLIADRALPMARLIVVDDASTDPALATWLDGLASDGQIHLIRNRRSAGFAAAANRGMQDAEGHDVVLLHATGPLPPGWLPRLAGHAHAGADIGSVCAAGEHAGFGAEAQLPDGMTAVQADGIIREVNAGRAVTVPGMVGGCLYVKLAALAAVGGLDSGRFPDAAALTDLCLRAGQRGWRHVLAWDCFVPATPAPPSPQARAALQERHPDYPARVKRAAEDCEPCLFTFQAALFRSVRQPVILAISHNYGGGVRRHVASLIDRYRDKAGFLSLEGGDQAVTLYLEGRGVRPSLKLPAVRIEDLVTVLRSINVTRAHIHHLLDVDMDIRRLMHRLKVPFDVTVHDYFVVCPQLTFLKWPDGVYCGEPGPGTCTACIAENNPNAARDIFAWRADRAWIFTEAERVICPSVDVKARLGRYGLDGKAIVAPHEPQTDPLWHLSQPKLSGQALRVVLLGVLADHKGAHVVASVAEAAGPELSVHLIGHVEPHFPADALPFISQTGRYAEADLPRLLKQARPHVIWLPSTCPETFSYTLSTAIETGVPIVATDIGSFPERLAGRPNTWLVDAGAGTEAWLAVFRQVRAALASPKPPGTAPRPMWPSDFYETGYLRPPASVRSGRRKIVIVPERQDREVPTPSAYQRLLLPLDHAAGEDHEVILADPETITGFAADMIVTHRLAFPNMTAAGRLIAHARHTGAALVYDLDDEPAEVSRGDADATQREQDAALVRHLLREADAVWLSNPRLAQRVAAIRREPEVLETRLDERLWDANPPPPPFWPDPVRVLCMGSIRNGQNYALIEPALIRLQDEYAARLVIDVIGMTGNPALGGMIRRPRLSRQSARSYPAFVHWLTTHRPTWHIGLVPLVDLPANRCASDFKAMDFAALGMYVLASDVPAYRGSIADGPAGHLVANDADAWYAAIGSVVRDQALRRAGYDRSRAAFLAHGTLAGQKDRRRAAIAKVLRAVTAAVEA